MSNNLADRVSQILTRYSMLSPGQKAGVAVSGGADSVVLLQILHRLSPLFDVSLTVLHVNHGLRGDESEADEVFVRELAESLGLECLVKRSGINGGNIEQEAREARRKFFAECRRTHHLARVALGHTRSDQAETVFFRLLRGSGTRGLAGMRWTTEEGLIRPLLSTSRGEVRGWGKAEGFSWREDSSNSDLGMARNRLRNEVLPALSTSFNPNLEGVLANAAEIAQGEEDYWNEEVASVFERITRRTHLGLIFQLGSFSGLPIALRRRLIRRALLELRGDLRLIDAKHVEAILAICESNEGHERVVVPGADALRSFDTVLLAKAGDLSAQGRHYRLELSFGELYELPFRAGLICVDQVKPGFQNCANFKEGNEFRAEVAVLGGALPEGEQGPVRLMVRNWEPGDQLWRAGHREPEKIKTLFQQQRVLLWKRRNWPVLLVGEEIAWTRQFGVAAHFNIAPSGLGRIYVAYRQIGE